jgi:Gly-Xaa carboxypeptidase
VRGPHSTHPQSKLTPYESVFAFGFDEEIGGPQGAATIGPYLLDKYGKDGVALLIDEGGSGVSEEYGQTFILPGTSEKGNVSPLITVETSGGHR